MIYSKPIQVDLAHQYLNDVIRLHEGDALGAQLQISMYNNGDVFSLAGFTIKYDAVIAGYLAEQDATATVLTGTSNVIVVPITENMCAKSGTLEIDVKLKKTADNSVLFLQKFEAFVQRRVINEDVIIDVSGTTIGAKIAALEAKFPVATADIAEDAVTTSKIKNLNVTSAKLASGAVTATKIEGGAVGNVKIADGAVTTEKIADGNVTTDKLGSGAVTSTKIASGAVTTTKIASGAVTTAKIDMAAVTTEKIENKAVTTSEIDDKAVTKVKLADDVKEVYMTLLDQVGTMHLADDLEQGQMFLYMTDALRVVAKVGASSYITLARQDELSSLASVVGDANDLLESALNYQS